MKVWVYYSTDGDSGWYGVRLFATQTSAEAYKAGRNDAYGRIAEVPVWP